MTENKFKKIIDINWSETDVLSSLKFFFKWLGIAGVVGFLSGSASAFFLWTLDWATQWREAHVWIIWLLPLGGLVSGLIYHYFGQDVEKGNNLILEEINTPKKTIPFKMAPLVLAGTLISHFFGGSAGREGTAVQMGGAIGDQFTGLFKLNKTDRQLLLITGISAGFASVFGTPLAGAIFALEVMVIGKLRHEAILPSVLAAVIADYTCKFWHIGHTRYSIPLVPEMKPELFFWTLLAGVIFGICSLIFVRTTDFFKEIFKSKISFPPLRPVAGGVIIAITVYLMGTTRYIGLGIPVIVDSFYLELPSYDFIIKILLTAITLGAGFKGGEVTPLFFIGAVLGNALAFFIPLPLALLAGMGFVAVFCGATNTPIASIFLGIELFGAECGVFVAIACLMSYLFSGKAGIYSSQITGNSKNGLVDF
jgi:H+/Cl- antiporter ClcA